jgi:hypothetical protein
MGASFDAHELFADLAEKERARGHHSPEGRAICTLSRALQGWSAQLLSDDDVLILCDQAIEDWLKGRLQISTWSRTGHTVLFARALEDHLLEPQDIVSLQRLHRARLERRAGAGELTDEQPEAALLFCIRLVERHWEIQS